MLFGCGLLLLIGALGGLSLFVFTDFPTTVKSWIFTIRERNAATKETEAPEPPPEPQIIEKEVIKIVEKQVEVPVPVPPELPDTLVRYKQIDVTTLFNGIQIESDLQSFEGGLASAERDDPDAYTARFELRLRVPQPATTIEDLAKDNAHLPKILTHMPRLVETAEPSKYYHYLYDLKQRQVQANITHLEDVLSRHNFYDCNTVLEMTHPDSGRKVFFLQGEMDVVADGSDGDRMATFDDYVASSTHFQPTTSYGWAKRTKTPNPLIERMGKELAEAKERYKVKGLTRGENASLERKIESIPRYIAELKSRSFLIAQEDPFVVIPLSTREFLGRNAFMPRIGDYAVVIYEDKLYPAIVGDYGPTTKTGEASLRIAQQLNPDANPYRRPVSELAISYLIFPDSAEKPFGPPKLADWREKCIGLLEEIGGIGEGYELHEWEDRFNKPEPPSETPEPPSETPDDPGDPGGVAAEDPPAEAE